MTINIIYNDTSQYKKNKGQTLWPVKKNLIDIIPRYLLIKYNALVVLQLNKVLMDAAVNF
jgi:hypothetical protein